MPSGRRTKDEALRQRDGALGEAKPDGVDLILRIAPGDRREIAVSVASSQARSTIEEGARIVVSELWLSGEPEPTLAVATYASPKR